MTQIQQIESIDEDITLRQVDLLSRPHALVRALAVDVDRAHGAWPLSHRAAPRDEGSFDIRLRHLCPAIGEDIPLCVIGRRRDAEDDGGQIFLALVRQVAQ